MPEVWGALANGTSSLRAGWSRMARESTGFHYTAQSGVQFKTVNGLFMECSISCFWAAVDWVTEVAKGETVGRGLLCIFLNDSFCFQQLFVVVVVLRF